MRIPEGEQRTPEQLKEHYIIEKELASRLRSASREERRHLYTALYDELFRRVPHHPQLTQKADPQTQAEAVSAQLALLSRFLKPDSTFLEVGPGDCRLAFEVAKRVRKVIAVDVSEEITRTSERPDNFELIISDGSSIPVPVESVDVAYSNQLMEHLHPDDALLPDRTRVEAIWEEICRDPRLLYFGVEVEEHMVSSCTMTIIPNLTRGARPYAVVENVITHPDFRRRGYGTRLLQHCQQIAWNRGCYKVMLLTGSKREETLRFYERAGFQRGVKTGYISYPPE